MFMRKIIVLSLHIYQWFLIVVYHKSISVRRSMIFFN